MGDAHMDMDSYLREIEAGWPPTGQPPSRELVTLCQQAVAAYPESSTLWYDLGILMHRCEDERGYRANDFRRCFEQAVQCDGDNAEAHQELGYVLDVYYDDYPRAAAEFEAALRLGAGAESHFGLARVLAQMGDVDAAIAALSPPACPFPDDPDIQLLRAEILAGDWCWETREEIAQRKTDHR